jgi:hypothetical protein
MSDNNSNKRVEQPKFHLEKYSTSCLDFKNLEEKYFSTDENDLQMKYNPFSLEKFQKYNPIYSLFFDVSKEEFDHISLNQKYTMIDHDKITVTNNSIFLETQQPIFLKYSPLLDPTRYMIGKYNMEDETLKNLPTVDNINDIHSKIKNIHNASYVDSFFCYLSSQLLNQHGFLNGIDYYGSYVALQKKFKVNITDDLEYLNGSTFFVNHMNKLFHMTETEESFMNYGSRNNKQKIVINNISEKNLLEFEEIMEEGESIESINPLIVEGGDEEIVYYENNKTRSSTLSSESDDSSESSENSESNYTSEDDDEEKEDSDDSGDVDDSDEFESIESDEESEDSEEETQIYAYVDDFPIQMICLEKCDGTIDELFTDGKMNETEGASALFQVIMSLITYQKAFHFTHNDLHTNNIMYKHTDLEFLYYQYDNTQYRVPTYGKIYKIIDFGRSIYTFQNQLFCSDSFALDGDASTQYNFEPFYNEKKPVIEPNSSFDLCRLGCSIYDFIIDEEKYKEMDEFQKIIHTWCLDDHNKNVLYKKDGEERYPNFKLYKMIARTVHQHTPKKQLQYSFFNQFEIDLEDMEEPEKRINIDEIPCYV